MTKIITGYLLAAGTAAVLFGGLLSAGYKDRVDESMPRPKYNQKLIMETGPHIFNPVLRYKMLTDMDEDKKWDLEESVEVMINHGYPNHILTKMAIKTGYNLQIASALPDYVQQEIVDANYFGKY